MAGREHRQFWEQIHQNFPNATDTMQMTFADDPATAEVESARDVDELFALVPPLRDGARIVELAAGYGRFTARLAQRGHVIAYDFVEKFCAGNTARGLPNVEIRNEDVLAAELPHDLDLVFWSWLLQLMSDDDAVALLAKVTRSLRPGGVLLFRESCADETWRWEGPPTTMYRAPAWYQAHVPRAEVIVLKTWEDQRAFRAIASTSASF